MDEAARWSSVCLLFLTTKTQKRTEQVFFSEKSKRFVLRRKMGGKRKHKRDHDDQEQIKLVLEIQVSGITQNLSNQGDINNLEPALHKLTEIGENLPLRNASTLIILQVTFFKVGTILLPVADGNVHRGEFVKTIGRISLKTIGLPF